MIKNYAIVEGGMVVNIVVIDSTDDDLIRTFGAIEIPEDIFVDIGFPYQNNQFINPNPIQINTNEPTLTFDQIQEILAELSANNATQV